MPQPSCISDDRLRGLLLGELSEEDAAPLESHLLECPECVARTRSLRSADTLVVALQQARERELPAAQSSSINRLVQRLSDRSQLGTHSSLLDATTAPDAKEGPKVQDLIALLEPAAGPDELGRLGSFRVLKLLGHGGMGAVFLAEDMHLRRQVALKLLRPDRGSDAESVERFMREARAAAAVRHDHVVTIYQVGQAHGIPFIAQELLEGETLDDALRRAEGVSPPVRMPIAEALRIGREIATGLAAAHHRGLLHRDIKPSNIWLEQASGVREHPGGGPSPIRLGTHREADASRSPQCRVKLLDFGLARNQQGDEQLTQAGIVVGTPAYMSPEQATSQPLDARSDLFSLGCVLYRMVTGRLPFQGTNTLSMLRSLAVDEPPRSCSLNPDVPAVLSELIANLLSKDPACRPNSAANVAHALSALETQFRALPVLLSSPPLPSPPSSAHFSRSPRRFLIALGTAAAALLVGGAIIITITHRDGSTTQIEVEEGAKLEIASSSTSRLPGSASVKNGTSGQTTRAAPTNSSPQSDSVVASPTAPSPSGGADRAAAQWALRMGGNLTIQIDGETVDIQSLDKLPQRAFLLTKLNLAKRPVHDHDLLRLAGLNHLDSLELRETNISDAALKHIEGLPALKQLILYKTKITDAAFDSFTKMPALRELSLSETKTTTEGWRRLKELPRLSQLHVAMMPFTDSDLVELAVAQPELETLNLWGSAVTDAGMSHLAKLSKLQLLYLNFTKVTGRGLAPLGSLPRLESLGLPRQLSFADEAAQNLSPAPALASLDLQNTDLSDTGLMFLGKIKSLRDLKLGGTKITATGLADLVNLPQLVSLQLIYPPISEQGAALLAQIDELKRLELGEVQTDKALASLSRLTSLEELRFRGSNVTDAGLAHLERMPNLRLLDCGDTSFTEAGFLTLAASKSLKTLVLGGAQASPTMVERLRIALPQLEIRPRAGP